MYLDLDPPPPTGATMEDLTSCIDKLTALRDAGVVDAHEFATKRQALVDRRAAGLGGAWLGPQVGLWLVWWFAPWLTVRLRRAVAWGGVLGTPSWTEGPPASGGRGWGFRARVVSV